MSLTAVALSLLRTKLTSTDKSGCVMIGRTNPVNIWRNSIHSRRLLQTTVILSNVGILPFSVVEIGFLPSIFWIIGLFAFPAAICDYSITEHAKKSTKKWWSIINGHSNGSRFVREGKPPWGVPNAAIMTDKTSVCINGEVIVTS